MKLRDVFIILLPVLIPVMHTGAVDDRPAETPGKSTSITWISLEPGLELGEFAGHDNQSAIRILRIAPKMFRFTLFCVSAGDSPAPLTVSGWADKFGLAAAINPSMYQKDFRAAVSLMKKPGHINNPIISRDQSVFAASPREPGLPPADLLDRECDDFQHLKNKYRILVQSIRLVSCRGRNVWVSEARRTAMTVIGRDSHGNILFIHAGAGYTPHELAETLQQLPLDLDRAMYTEGGSPAQLSIRSDTVRRDFTGGGGAVPNVLGIVRKPHPKGENP